MGDWRLGGLQEYTLVDSRYTCRVPGGIKDVDAVLYPVNAFTSFVGLFGGKGARLFLLSTFALFLILERAGLARLILGRFAH